MTFLEKVTKEHIEDIDFTLPCRCVKCPYMYNYESRNESEKNCFNFGEGCVDCWNRQIPEDNNIEEKEVSKPMTKVEQHLELVTALNKLYEQKNHDYGDSFGKSYAEDGLVMAKIRISDKFNRFKTLIKSDAKVNDESIRDTLIDLANYALMTVMELDNEKENK